MTKSLTDLYTARWNLSEAIKPYENNQPIDLNKQKELLLDAKQSIDSILSAVSTQPVTPPQPEPPRPSPGAVGAKLLSHPLANFSFKHGATKKFRKGYPEGLIVHFTAGQCDTEDDMKGTMSWGKEQGYAFWGIGPTGKLYQSHKLDVSGAHAGSSSWPSLGSSVSQYTLGVEIACAGKVDASGKSWFDKTYPASRLRTVSSKDNIQAGTYVKFTDAQEKALIELCLWLKRNNPDVFNFDLVLGHDSVSPGRKSDPGGSLSMTIPQLQAKLKELYKQQA